VLTLACLLLSRNGKILTAGFTQTLRYGCEIGRTQNVKGVLEVMAGIRRLATWAVDTYWPWYKAEVLRLPSDAGD
jgi:hypothetical protein